MDELDNDKFRPEGFKGYPVYKLIRAVNRQYPNNGFINYVDVREDMYDNYKGQLINEDLRDLINETLQEVYKDVAIDEVFSFPTVPGQNQYVLPDDCDLRDIQEVTRTYPAWRGPLCPPPGPGQGAIFSVTFYANGGEGEMEPIEANIGEKIILPECTFVGPDGAQFIGWNIGEKIYQPGEEVSMYSDLTAVAEWSEGVEQFSVRFTINPIAGNIDGESSALYYVPSGGTLEEVPTATIEEGFMMRGWSLDGVHPLTDEQILARPVEHDETYVAITEGISYTVNIYISTENGTGILHYTPVGGTAQTRTMTYGGATFTFVLEYGQTISSLFSQIEMYDSTDSVFVVDLINVPITGDTNIPVAVPVAQPYEEAEPEDPGRDPEADEDIPGSDNELEGGN